MERFHIRTQDVEFKRRVLQVIPYYSIRLNSWQAIHNIYDGNKTRTIRKVTPPRLFMIARHNPRRRMPIPGMIIPHFDVGS